MLDQTVRFLLNQFKILKMKPEKLLRDETRRKILNMTAKNEMTVTDLAKELGITKATVSHHLKLLSEANMIRVVRTEISGNFIRKYYRSVFGDVEPVDSIEKTIISGLKQNKKDDDLVKAMLRALGVLNVQAGNDLFLRKIGFDIGYHILADLIQDDIEDGIAGIWERFGLGDVTEFSKSRLVVENCYYCNGLPFSGFTYCKQDEGIIEGIFLKKLGERYSVREVNCWGTGSDKCVFEVRGGDRNSV